MRASFRFFNYQLSTKNEQRTTKFSPAKAEKLTEQSRHQFKILIIMLKRLFSFSMLAIIAVSFLSFSACKKDKKSDDDNNNNINNPTYSFTITEGDKSVSFSIVTFMLNSGIYQIYGVDIASGQSVAVNIPSSVFNGVKDYKIQDSSQDADKQISIVITANFGTSNTMYTSDVTGSNAGTLSVKEYASDSYIKGTFTANMSPTLGGSNVTITGDFNAQAK
jgi:hypothetical protein